MIETTVRLRDLQVRSGPDGSLDRSKCRVEGHLRDMLKATTIAIVESAHSHSSLSWTFATLDPIIWPRWLHLVALQRPSLSSLMAF